MKGFSARRARRRTDGAALVEFALLMPVLFMLIFGMITGALAYDRNLAISYSAQQTARYAATLSLDAYDDTDALLDDVHDRVVATSEGTLVEGTDDREICVAIVLPGVETRSRTVTTSDATPTRNGNACFDDELPDGERRVQVSLSRGDAIDLVIFGTIDVTLAKDVVARYEIEPAA